jgi:hypothetical protein
VAVDDERPDGDGDPGALPQEENVAASEGEAAAPVAPEPELSGAPFAVEPDDSFSGILPGAPVEPPPAVTIPGAPSRPSGPAGPTERPERPEPPGASGRPRRDDERTRAPRGPRPDLSSTAEPVYRDRGGYRMRIEPADLARLRELPGSKGKSDRELGEAFLDGQSERFAASLAEDVPTPADVRVVVDPYSRQAFLAVEKKIRSILSF